MPTSEQLKKKEEEIKPHPALQFGPISQTIAIMSALSLVMSVVSLPVEMLAFYYLFSRLSFAAVLCLVCHGSIVWYGYNQALSKLPKPKDAAEERLRKMRATKPDRPDMWAHTRSHPSAFLTTRHAPPRMFPFPLGKSRPDASIKDELWWEGGNAPHVGHFNKPEISQPEAYREEVLVARVKESMEREEQEKIWKKRIRTIQYLCVIIIVAFVNTKVAIAALCHLIYWTISTELEDMLKPPTDMEPYHYVVDTIVQKSGRTQAAPKAKKDRPAGGMSYIYDPVEAGQLGPVNTAIPIDFVPAPVLMTSENHWYAGPGEQIKAQ